MFYIICEGCLGFMCLCTSNRLSWEVWWGRGFVHPMDTQHLWWKLPSVLANLTRCLVQTSAAPDVSVAPSARADPPVVAASPVLPWHLEGHGPWSVRDPQAA